MDIYIIREAFVNGKWLCCEQSYKDYKIYLKDKYGFDSESERIRDDSSADVDFGRCSQLFGLLSGQAFMTNAQLFEENNGLPENMSQSAIMRIEDENKSNDEFCKKHELFSCKIQYYNCTFKDMENFLSKWREDIIDTGSIPYDFISDLKWDKFSRFENGIYNCSRFRGRIIRGNPKRELIKLSLKMFDDTESNVMKHFIEFLNNEPCKGEFNGNLNSIENDKKRIIFWFTY